jgi:hypothetical protein
MSSTLKYSGDTNLYATVAFGAGALGERRGSGWSVHADRPRGREIFDRRIGSHGLQHCVAILFVQNRDDDRIGDPHPGSSMVAVSALRRNTAAEMSSNAEAATCTPIRMLRARAGRRSRTLHRASS